MAETTYVALDEFQRYIGATTDTEDIPTLTTCVYAASRSVDAYTMRRFWIDDGPSARVYRAGRHIARLDEGDLLMVDDIAEDTGITVRSWSGSAYTDVEVSTYEVYPESAIARDRPVTGILAPGLRWSGYRKFEVTARWGWPAIPPEVAQATLIQASRLWHRKDAKGPVMGDAEFGVMRLPLIDPDVRNLLQHLRVPLVA